MLTAYLTFLIVGGAFVIMSVFSGSGADADADADFDADVDADFDADVDADFDADVDADFDADGGSDIELDVDTKIAIDGPDSQALWMPFFSFKFWTFGSCFFGLTGCVLMWVSPGLTQFVIVPISVAMGTGVGSSVAWALRKLRQNTSDSMIRGDDLVGATGIVEVPFERGRLGRVRLTIKGMNVGYTAITSWETPLTISQKVVVVGIDGHKVRVVPSSALNNPESLPNLIMPSEEDAPSHPYPELMEEKDVQ
jgi:membrane protein implicated in regulation of membrane protease activity